MTEKTIDELAEQYEYTNGTYGFKQAVEYCKKIMYSDMQEYAEFCVECDRAGLKLIAVKDWFEQFSKLKNG
jgi:hypothetical protein